MNTVLKNINFEIDYETAYDIVSTMVHNINVISDPNCTMPDVYKYVETSKKNEMSYIDKINKKKDKEHQTVENIDVKHLFNIKNIENIGIKCPKCKKFETSYKLFAKRSADEGMSAICSCRSCEHQWIIAV